METVLTDSPVDAAARIQQGEIVAFPTETVYGLGADIFNESAVRSIFEAKGRPRDNPLIAHIFSLEQISELTSNVSEVAWNIIHQFFPGPLTVVLPKSVRVPDVASAGLNTIGVRMPLHGLANSFLREAGVPVVAPSANLSGKPSPTTWQAVLEDLNGRIPCILKGEITRFGIESTVVDCTKEIPILLRPGSVTLEQIQDVTGQVEVVSAMDLVVVRSPGLKHRHYSPRANVVAVAWPPDSAPPKSAYIGLTLPQQSASFELTKIVRDPEDYAHELFRFFRDCDAIGIDIIYCQTIPETGVGKAVMDRLRRASEGAKD